MTDNRHLWEYDEAQGDFESLCGIDEVGRGPLAGPVCAACVMLPAGLELPTLKAPGGCLCHTDGVPRCILRYRVCRSAGD